MTPGFWYLGSPYSKYPLGLNAAHKAVCENAALLIRAGIPVYSPIAHTHPIAVHGEIDPLDHDIWLPVDAPLMDAAAGLIVLKLDSWPLSFGLAHEIGEFSRAGKPVVYMTPGVVPKKLTPRRQAGRLHDPRRRAETHTLEGSVTAIEVECRISWADAATRHYDRELDRFRDIYARQQLQYQRLCNYARSHGLEVKNL